MAIVFQWVMLVINMIDIKHKLFISSIRARLWWYEWRDKQYRRRYCRKGFHRIRSLFYSCQKNNEKEKKVNFLRCHYCNYIFFANKEAKEMYMELKGNSDKRMQDLLKQTLETHNQINKG